MSTRKAEKKRKKSSVSVGVSSLRNKLHKSCTLVIIKKFKNTKTENGFNLTFRNASGKTLRGNEKKKKSEMGEVEG